MFNIKSIDHVMIFCFIIKIEIVVKQRLREALQLSKETTQRNESMKTTGSERSGKKFRINDSCTNSNTISRKNQFSSDKIYLFTELFILYQVRISAARFVERISWSQDRWWTLQFLRSIQFSVSLHPTTFYLSKNKIN